MTKRVQLGAAMPFFIVEDLGRALACYRDLLGFAVEVLVPDDAPFFAIVARGDARFCLKEIGPDVPALPNHTRHEGARWDAFVHTADPDALFAELTERGVTVHEPLADTDDGLRAFEIRDSDGYVLCFGRPL